MTALLALLSFAVMGRRPLSEAFASIWSALLLCTLAIGGTMIMRKFHNSLAVGFFMGGIVAASQLFFLLALLFIGYAKDQKFSGSSNKEEAFMAVFALVQSVLLGSFAIILAAHRSEIIDKPGTAVMNMMDELHGMGSATQAKASTNNKKAKAQTAGDSSTAYQTPYVQA
jgi:uncharacterized membrane protein